MGRKSREKRERAPIPVAGEAPAEHGFVPDAAAAIEAPGAPGAPGAPPPPAGRRPRRSRKARPVGARVARVAADDETWEAFKELCGSTPASVRLGQLVADEVERSRRPAADQDAVAAVDAIRAQLDALEALVRVSDQR